MAAKNVKFFVLASYFNLYLISIYVFIDFVVIFDKIYVLCVLHVMNIVSPLNSLSSGVIRAMDRITATARKEHAFWVRIERCRRSCFSSDRNACDLRRFKKS